MANEVRQRSPVRKYEAQGCLEELSDCSGEVPSENGDEPESNGVGPTTTTKSRFAPEQYSASYK